MPRRRNRSGTPERASVTVLIPTYERAELLPRTLDCALAQDYEPLEILVLDDGSTDDTPAVLRDYERRFPGRIRSKRHGNRGQPRTLNRGFAMIATDLVCLISSDDLMATDAVRTLAGALEQDEGAVVAYSDYDLIDAAGQPFETVVPLDFDPVTAVRMQDCAVGPAAVFRRSVVDRVGGWDPAYRYCPDFDFWIRVGLVGRFVHVRRTLAGMRNHPGSLSSHRNLQMADERIALIRRLYERDDLPEALLAVRDEALRTAYLQAAVLVTGEPHDSRERFALADRLGGVILANAPAEDALATVVRKEADLRRALDALEEAHEEMRRLHREVANRDAELAALRP